MIKNRVSSSSTDFKNRRSENHTLTNDVKKFLSEYLAFISEFDEISIRDLHILLLQIFEFHEYRSRSGHPFLIGAQKLHLRLHRKLHGSLKVKQACEILFHYITLCVIFYCSNLITGPFHFNYLHFLRYAVFLKVIYEKNTCKYGHLGVTVRCAKN